jgi:hypothetical protein
VEPLFGNGATRVPNQEKLFKASTAVTYRDNTGNVLEILLPNWEIKQAEFRCGASNPFGLQLEQ